MSLNTYNIDRYLKRSDVNLISVSKLRSFQIETILMIWMKFDLLFYLEVKFKR